MPATTVLIVENDPGDRALIDQSLSNEGYRLMHASTGDEAVQRISEEEVQIVLLSDFGLTKTLHGMRRNAPIQLILLLRADDDVDVEASFESGPDDFIRKPFDANELKARTRAAQTRWHSQATLLKEREFFRIAVAEEERLSSLVLDQNQSLKDAYDKIRRLNEELERANKELEQIAAYDSLSGLLNRRSLFTRLAIEIERCLRLEVPLAGLMIDIDRFKNVNDNHGHPCGDMVIREIGARLSSGLRKYDYAGRYGGEEFFIILSNSTEEQALGISERFRHDMEEAAFSCDGNTFHVTVSIGVSCFRPGETQEDWIERTDQAMYRAKQAGRNRIIAA
ncbi:MAG TPA: diguanylate cyclase [Spirochaetia bacterium]|nr:diguanylate cyclase [Spirochaetia bacterium]